jgi:hypothetical protein
MKWALVASVLVLSGVASAQSYVEENARDAICEWSFKDKRGIEKCHIIAMGIHGTGANVMMLQVDGMVVSFVEEDGHKTVEIGQGGFWDFKSKWKGKYTERFNMLDKDSMNAMSVYKLSNGYQIKMVY